MSQPEEMQDAELQTITKEEQGCLEKVKSHLEKRHTGENAKKVINYDAELVSLRDQISSARAEDIPPLLEDMERLMALASRQSKTEEQYVDPRSPYFGRMVLEEEGRSREVLIGRGTYLDTKSGIRIVDWRDAPVSRLYYRYAEGDDYDEEFGGREVYGEVRIRRSVTITDQGLRRINCPQGNFANSRTEGWVRIDDARLKLAGGQGSAIRAEAPRGKLGVGEALTENEDKHLKEITPLIDGRQFELITQPDSGLVVIQGGAGSGKTTIGLHRLAYLAFHDAKRFRPDRMLVIVFNEALVRYIGQVLPSLGLRGVQIRTYQDWAARLRATAIPQLPRAYSDETPSIVTRLKKHPRMLALLDAKVEELAREFQETVAGIVQDDPSLEDGLQTFLKSSNRPLIHRFHAFRSWILDHEEALEASIRQPVLRELERRIERLQDVIPLWADLLTDLPRWKEVFEQESLQEFRQGELERAHAWCVKSIQRALTEMEEREEAKEDRDARGDDDYRAIDGLDLEDRATLDREDDTLLLRLLQRVRGPLRKGQAGKEALSYEHILVDEAQDLSPVEMRVIFDTITRGQSVTLAGDTAQRLHMDNGFSDWKTVLSDLGLAHVEVEPLKLTYRSTAEILDLAQHVLGHLQPDDPPVATRHGAPVELFQHGATGDSVAFLSEALRELSITEPRASIAVVTRYPEQADLVYDGLKRGDVPYLRRVADQDFPFKPGVDVTDIRQVKGLEFDYVILVEVSESSYPTDDESRHLLHIGVTRAAHQLWLLAAGSPSKLLPEELRDRGY
ncbi:MAG: ATP-binding domain-containing protein [Polyangiaceae bacterium]|nr:ATP-binding domain-containing protein [Polyangiaceae bacterium]